MRDTITTKYGLEVGVVRVQQDGCTNCIGENNQHICRQLKRCAVEDATVSSFIWVEATPENLARAVLERMNHENNPTS